MSIKRFFIFYYKLLFYYFFCAKIERMKTVLIEMLAFVLLCVFGTAAGGFLTMLYSGATNFVAGSNLTVFSFQEFINGAIIFYPAFLFFIPMFLFLTLVRHPRYNKISGAATIAVLSLAAWVFTAPIFFRAAKAQNVFEKQSPAELSSGYFRNINGRLNYFTFTSGNYVSGLRVDNSYFLSNNSESSIHFLDSNYMNFKRDQLGFSDPIIGENLTPPPVLLKFLQAIVTIETKAYEASSSGILNWLFFSSIMAALVSIGAVISASEWKLADAFYITFDTFVILTLNNLCILGRFDALADTLNNLGGVFQLAAARLQAVLNCAVVLLLIFLGIFKATLRAIKNKRSGI